MKTPIPQSQLPARPYFSKTHYEELSAALRKEARHEKLIAAEILCRVFQQDNPNFNPTRFMTQVMAEEDQS
jgi:hypothetical protein